MRTTRGNAWWLTLVAAAVSCTGRHVKPPPSAAPIVQPPPMRIAPLEETEAEGSPSAPDPRPEQSAAEEPPLAPRRRATEADGSPRPYVIAELTPPSGYGIIGASLTVLAAPPKVAGGFEPSYPWAGDGPPEVVGVIVFPQWYWPLAWEQIHGSLDDYSPSPDAADPIPSFTFSGRVVRRPMEMLVFGEDAHWTATVPLLPCAKNPCPKYVSPVDSLVVVVSAGTAERLGIGKGWSIAVGG